MNRGFRFYFGQAIRLSAKVLFKGGKLFLYWIYLLASTVGRLLPCFGTVFAVTDARIAKTVKDEQDLSIVRAFDGLEKASAFGAAMLGGLIHTLILLGGLLGLGIIAFLLTQCGLLFNTVGSARHNYMPLILSIPCIVAAAIFVIAVGIGFAPRGYMIDNNEKVGAVKVLNASAQTMRLGGKITCLLNVLIPLLVLAAYGGLTYGGFCLIVYLLSTVNLTLTIVFVMVWLILALIGFIVVAPLFMLTATVANFDLFSDIALDPVALEMRTKGVFIKRSRRLDVNDVHGGDTLSELFETMPPIYDAPPPPKQSDRIFDTETVAAEESTAEQEQYVFEKESVSDGSGEEVRK